eukprot:gene5432-biopygen3196
MRTEQPKCQKALSRAVLACRFETWRDRLDPKSRALAIVHAASSAGRRSLASEWLVTTPFGVRTTIPDPHYRLALRKRLDLPVSSGGDRCRVPRRLPGPVDVRRPVECCGTLLAPHADHAQACARAMRTARHDRIADLCAAFHREAGHKAHRETEVPGVPSSTQKGPIRADVLVRAAAPATWECTEVKVRHVFHSNGELALADAGQVDAMLEAQEAAVHAYYRPVGVRPWVFTSLDRPGSGFCTDLRRLARLRLRRADVGRAVSQPS